MADKTTVPGMNQRSFGTSSSNPFSGFNNPNPRPFGPHPGTDPFSGVHASGTVVPGMDNPGETLSNNRANNSGKPLVGFLYSVSRTPFGEYWPLYLGQNIIGRDSKCSIQLEEGTVSSEHALIMVRKMKKPEKLIASIVDARSTCGTMINGESLGFDQVECKNMDIITIGENYELLFILIDTSILNLSTSEDFVSAEANASSPMQREDVISSFSPEDFPRPYSAGTVGQSGNNSSSTNISSRISNPVNSDRTVATGGQNPQAGGTIPR